MELEYPWFLKTYDEFPHKIMRSDAVRAHALRSSLRRFPPTLSTIATLHIEPSSAHHFEVATCIGLRSHAIDSERRRARLVDVCPVAWTLATHALALQSINIACKRCTAQPPSKSPWPRAWPT